MRWLERAGGWRRWGACGPCCVLMWVWVHGRAFPTAGEIFRKVAAITPVVLRGDAAQHQLPSPAEACDAGAAPTAPSM